MPSTPAVTVPAPTTTIPVTTPPTTAPAAFTSAVTPVTAAELGASWRAGCPVGPDQLRRVDVTYIDFDGRPQTGALIVHADAVDAVQAVFRRLYDARFPIRRIEPVDRYGGSDDASMAADNTSGFNCRSAVRADGVEQWSSHAYGRAIDVNPLENPYVLGRTVLPPEGAPFTDRAQVRPGMAVAGGPLVDAFAASGWQWGGR
ncbi:MAG: M15 family metallopeptidase, partial [Actinobacteria bacterium]|nr:M15 family metallopeptidase [Actinomycetota bacterium]